jgi:predicted O-methyltransferase YrrM
LEIFQRCGILSLMRKDIPPAYEYIESQIKPEAPDKLLARELSKQLGLDTISISPTEASFIRFMTAMIKPQKIVEIGTLTGLSSLYFLETLSTDGMLWTFEKSTEHAELASQSLSAYIQSGQCQIKVGDAVQQLPTIENEGPFDAIFIDGNKAAYYNYWIWAKNNLRRGGLIFIDNVFLAGSVWGDKSLQRFSDKQIANVQKMTTEIMAHLDFTSTFVPTTEGLLMARKK